MLRQRWRESLYHCEAIIMRMFAFRTAKRRIATCFGAALLPLFIATFTWSQSLPLRDTSQQFLQEHHISITKESVIAALRNDDADIRREASRVLSSHWPMEAVAPIQIAKPSPCSVTCGAKRRARETIELSSRQVTQGVTRERVKSEQHDICQQDERTHADSKSIAEKESANCVPPKEGEKH